MTIFGITVSAAVMWLMIAGIMAILEAITMGLTCIWFVGGAVCAAIAAAAGAPAVVQIIIFMVVSAILIACTRPLAKKKLNDRVQKTNVESVIGQTGIVEEAIPSYRKGQVRVDGKVWTAVSEGSPIDKGRLVKIKSVRGVTLTVEEIEETDQNR